MTTVLALTVVYLSWKLLRRPPMLAHTIPEIQTIVIHKTVVIPAPKDHDPLVFTDAISGNIVTVLNREAVLAARPRDPNLN